MQEKNPPLLNGKDLSNSIFELKEELVEQRHSDDIHDIITKIPSWILNWGITILGGIFLFIISIAAFISYPDTLKSTIKIETVDNVADIFTNCSGRIHKVFVTPGSIVKKGQRLLIIENADNPSGLIIINAPQDGRIAFVSILHEGYFLKINQQIFSIHFKKEHFFGIILLSQNLIDKVKINQRVLIQFRGSSSDHDYLNGRISYITDEPDKTGFFSIQVTIDKNKTLGNVPLKSWMKGNAEIITNDVTVLQRLIGNLVKWKKE